ncbi:hypothetical protein EJ02DRAFT_333413, partial [Clathrospora elynae]
PVDALVTSHAAKTMPGSSGESKPVQHDSGVNLRHPIKRSASDLVVASRSLNEAVTTGRLGKEPNLKADANQPQSQLSLRPPRPTAQRSSSSSQIELRSRYHDPSISSASLQKQLIEQTRPVRNRPPRPTRAPRGLTANTPIIKTRPTYVRSNVMRSSSDPDLAKAFANPKTRDRGLPIKPCIKKKAKSATTTPPGEFQQDDDNTGNRSLRRVKTVDFEENGSKPSLSLPHFIKAMGSPTQDPPNDAETLPAQAKKPKKTVKRSPSCPSMMRVAKSNVADPAFTRTDVHVIAIAPSWNAQDVANEEGSDPATPTMQIIETKSGSYEVIWDDVPSEHSIRLKGRRSSSASHALETVDSTTTSSLDRVNTKLANWSSTWNSPSESFKPTIVVFPDDDSRTTYHDCAVEEDDELSVLVPPNSKRSSAAPSRFPSRPASAPMTRTSSCEELSLQAALQESPSQSSQDWESSLKQSLVVPDPEGQRARLYSTSRKVKQPMAFRKLSNIDEDDRKFRGHRDSVTIAHSRLVHSGGISPELFAHRDSVSMAKKRMHARNHATSAAREIPRPKQAQFDAFDLDDDADDVSVPLSFAKEHAAQALKNSTSASILRPARHSANQRHIRIVE